MAATGPLLVVLACGPPLEAQSIRVGEDLPVAIDVPDGRVLVYPHLAIHPTDPNHLLATVWESGPAASFQERQALDRCSTLVSTDGGRGWSRHPFPYASCGDPWVAFGADGSAVFTAMVEHPDHPEEHDAVIVHHSADGGATWSERPVNLGTGHDHQTVAVDASAEARTAWLYLISGRETRAENGVWRANVFVARSRDGGRRFDPAVHLRPNNLFIKAETGVVLSDGTVVVSYVEAATRRVGYLPNRRAWVVRSTDGGQSFSTPMYVNDDCGPMPGNRFSLSALVADPPGGPFADRLHFLCNRTGGGAVLHQRSTDRGESWTDPEPVHAAPADTAVRRRLMGAAVSREGVLGVLWSDFGRSTECYDVHFAASIDGGERFLPEVRVNSEPSCPDEGTIGGPVPWSDGGAYWGIATDADGRFRLLWSDARTGTFRLRTATVEVGR